VRLNSAYANSKAHSRKRRLLGLLFVSAFSLPQNATAQTSTPIPVTQLATPQYLTTSSVGMFWHDQLVALGGRLQVPGKERMIMTGTYTDASGTQPIRLVWQLGDDVRIDLTGSSPITLISAGAGILQKGGTLAISNDDLLESLGDDRPETALYGGGGGKAGWRFLGAQFRTDDGTTPNYTGPFYDVYQLAYTVFLRSDQPLRWKLFIFDSTSKLLAKVLYTIQRGGQGVAVETDWSGWSNSGGNAIPGQIVRLENGTPVATINIANGQVTASANDGIFTQP